MENPCCFITSRTAGFIVGIFEIVLSSFFLVLTAVGIALVATAKSEIGKGIGYRCGYEYRCGNDYSDMDIYGWMAYVSPITLESLNIMMAAVLVVCVLTIIMASVLIHGIRMERLSLYKIWMIFKAICLISSLVSLVTVVGMGILKTPTVALIIWLDCVLQWYFYYIVYYLYVEIRNSGPVSQVLPGTQKL